MPNEKPVVYTPIAPTQEQEIVAPTKIDIPSYPDRGVAFAAFSKTLLGQGQYKLNPQTPFDANFDTVAVGGETGFTYTLSPNTNDTHYITSLFITTWPNSVNRIRFTDTSNGKVFFYKLNDNGAQILSYQVSFAIPIEIKGNRVSLLLSAAAAASDEYVINFYGWSEAN